MIPAKGDTVVVYICMTSTRHQENQKKMYKLDSSSLFITSIKVNQTFSQRTAEMQPITQQQQGQP